jgi:hypothetical protein
MIHLTIWIALALFVGAEALKRRDRSSSWPWRVSLAGAILCGVHMLVALGTRYGWSHRAAAAETARQTAAVYPVDSDVLIYVNYVFLAVWCLDALWWRTHRTRGAARGLITEWGLRALYLLIIVNAAVVFARPSARMLGIALVAMLIWTWRPSRAVNRTPSSTVL